MFCELFANAHHIGSDTGFMAMVSTGAGNCQIHGWFVQKTHKILEASGIFVHVEQEKLRFLYENGGYFCGCAPVLLVSTHSSSIPTYL